MWVLLICNSTTHSSVLLGMKKLSLIILLIIIVIVLSVTTSIKKYLPGNDAAPAESALLQTCPDEKIINRMPGPGTVGESSYYIVNGERKEIAEYDAAWVAANCTVPEQIVY